MNKLMGFYELKNMSLPSIPWEEYSGKEELSTDYLWTIRSAIFHGDDLNLPRLVGGNRDEAKTFADKLLDDIKDKGIVIYYPYFLANKSGTLNIYKDEIVIEAVKADLWNLVTNMDREVTIRVRDNGEKINGNKSFLLKNEKQQILKYVNEVRHLFRDDMIEGKGVLLEWSFAQKCNTNKEPVGEEYLIFYEARTI